MACTGSPLRHCETRPRSGATFVQALKIRDRQGLGMGPSIVASLDARQSLMSSTTSSASSQGLPSSSASSWPAAQRWSLSRPAVSAWVSGRSASTRFHRWRRGDGHVLIVERASRCAPAFGPDGHVDAICDAVDPAPSRDRAHGRRVRTLSPAAIRERLTQKLERPGSRDRDMEDAAPLEATIAWSYDLLERGGAVG